jgi:hypothetical protein
MTNKQIIEDYKNGIQHPGFSVFYCKEFDKHIIRRLPVKDEEKQVVLLEFEKNGLPPNGYRISTEHDGAVVKLKFLIKLIRKRTQWLLELIFLLKNVKRYLMMYCKIYINT